jgi:hypothetical protein
VRLTASSGLISLCRRSMGGLSWPSVSEKRYAAASATYLYACVYVYMCMLMCASYLYIATLYVCIYVCIICMICMTCMYASICGMYKTSHVCRTHLHTCSNANPIGQLSSVSSSTRLINEFHVKLKEERSNSCDSSCSSTIYDIHNIYVIISIYELFMLYTTFM